MQEDEKEDAPPEPAPILSPPTIKPVEVIDKLGDLSKIDISADVTKLLSSIKSVRNAINLGTSAAPAATAETKTPRDPRQASLAPAESAPSLSDPRMKSGKVERRETSIYEQGFINTDHKVSIYEQGTLNRSGKDVDLRSLDSLPKDLDMRSVSPFGDTDLRPSMGNDFECVSLF